MLFAVWRLEVKKATQDHDWLHLIKQGPLWYHEWSPDTREATILRTSLSQQDKKQP